MISLKRAVRELKREIFTPNIVTFGTDENFNSWIKVNNTVRAYSPEPTLLEFHQSIHKYVVAGVIGPYGSGKSTGMNWQSLFLAAKYMPPCKDGIRRAKCAFIRGTYDELKQTTFDLWMSWFGELGNTKATLKPLEVTHSFYDENGLIELKVIFLALDKIQQYKKLRSSNFTFAYVNEASESPEGILVQVLARTGRYPSMDLLDLSKVPQWFERDILIDDKWEKTKIPYWSGVIWDSNPPETESELFNLFEVNKPRGYKLFKQPAGLVKTKAGWAVNQNAENLKRLGLDYYAKQATGATEEFIKVFCCGEYGSIKAGQLIFEDYNDNIHVVEELQILPNVPLRLSFDTWFEPAVTISQYANEQLRVLSCLYESHLSLKAFIEDLVLPYLHQNFPNFAIHSVTFDPAGMMGENIKGATSDYHILATAFNHNADNVVFPAITNKIKTRLNSVQHFLSRIVRGQPGIVFDKTRCNMLRQGFLKHYVWREAKTTGEIIREPKKNKYSHVQDALQYECLSLVGNLDKEETKPGTYLAPPSQKINYYRGYYA